ncbi:MAG: hypothetical protein P1V20_28000 [Verrucomicrobiales bacterium]|nr:hypothetical protein [Verrucomicrobiales bacterium]
MNARKRLLIQGGVALLALWVALGAVIKIAGNMKPSPRKIMAYAEKHPLDEIDDPEQRKETIGRIAEMMNQLEGEDLRKLEEESSRTKRQAMLESMSPEEQWFFMEKRMGRAFSQMMEVFNEMDRPERKKVVERALKQIRDDERGMPMDEAEPEMIEKVANAGMKAYFEDSSAETKLDLAPLMEEMQKILSSPGRRHRTREQ